MMSSLRYNINIDRILRTSQYEDSLRTVSDETRFSKAKSGSQHLGEIPKKKIAYLRWVLKFPRQVFSPRDLVLTHTSTK